MYIGLRVKYRCCCQILVKLLILSTDFQITLKYQFQFHENLSSGSRVVLCGRTDRQTDMTKLVVALRNSANASKKGEAWEVSNKVMPFRVYGSIAIVCAEYEPSCTRYKGFC